MKGIIPYMLALVLKTTTLENFNMWKDIFEKVIRLFDSKKPSNVSVETPKKRYLIKEAKKNRKIKV